MRVLPYLDSTRIGIWGWSYGGFSAAWALAKDTEHLFNFALSVAPVTNFLYYGKRFFKNYYFKKRHVYHR